jgi:hypothetical protein
MAKHVTIIAVLNIAFGALGLIAASVVFLALAGGGLMSGDVGAMLVTSGIGSVIAAFIALFSVPGLIAGFGLLQRKNWARILTLVLGFINLINIPFGTVFGIYVIWALMNAETVEIFAAAEPMAHPAYPA